VLVVKELACQCRRLKRCGLNSRVEKLLQRRAQQLTPVRIPWREEPGGLYNPWGHKESDMTEVI